MNTYSKIRLFVFIGATVLLTIFAIITSSREVSAGHLQCQGTYTSTGLYSCDDAWNPLTLQYDCEPDGSCPLTGSATSSCQYAHDPVNACAATLYIPESCGCNPTTCVEQNNIDGLTTTNCSLATTPTPTNVPPTPTSGPSPTPGPTSTPPPGPTPTPGGGCDGNWWRCSGNIVLGPYSTEAACEADGGCSGCCQCGSPPCGGSPSSKMAFIVFEDLDEDGVWDFSANERRINSNSACTTPSNTQLVPGFSITVDGNSYSLTEDCNVGDSEYTGATCTWNADCNDGDRNGTAVSCNVWGWEVLDVERTCFDEDSCDACHWTGDYCSQDPARGVICSGIGSACNSSSPGYLKSGPMTIISKDVGTYIASVNIPSGWEASAGSPQTRTVNFSNDNSCSGLISFGVVQDSYCDIEAPDTDVSIGYTASITVAEVEEVGSTIQSVLFSVDDTSIATVTSANPDPLSPFTASFRGEGAGSTTYTAVATMANGRTCSDIGTISVENLPAWWQVKEGSILAGVTQTSGGNITSFIPSSIVCNPASSCDPYLITRDTNDRPGIAITKGSVSPQGSVSSAPYNWQTTGGTSPYAGTIYDYDYFESKIPDTTFYTVNGPAVHVNALAAPSPNYQGYIVHRWNAGGTLTILNTANASVGDDKVILFTDGNVRIEGNIPLDEGFFMIIASGNIEVAYTANTSGSSPDIEGIFFSDKEIRTGAFNQQLYVRGSLVGLGKGTTGTPGEVNGVVFQRSLDDNSATPAERVDFAPDLVMNFPPFLVPRSSVWKEVAP